MVGIAISVTHSHLRLSMVDAFLPSLALRLKVEIALAQGKNARDKRDDIKAREAKRDLQRISKNTYSY